MGIDGPNKDSALSRLRNKIKRSKEGNDSTPRRTMPLGEAGEEARKRVEELLGKVEEADRNTRALPITPEKSDDRPRQTQPVNKADGTMEVSFAQKTLLVTTTFAREDRGFVWNSVLMALGGVEDPEAQNRLFEVLEAKKGEGSLIDHQPDYEELMMVLSGVERVGFIEKLFEVFKGESSEVSEWDERAVTSISNEAVKKVREQMAETPEKEEKPAPLSGIIKREKLLNRPKKTDSGVSPVPWEPSRLTGPEDTPDARIVSLEDLKAPKVEKRPLTDMEKTIAVFRLMSGGDITLASAKRLGINIKSPSGKCSESEVKTVTVPSFGIDALLKEFSSGGLSARGVKEIANAWGLKVSPEEIKKAGLSMESRLQLCTELEELIKA